MPRGTSVVHLTGSHLGATSTEELLEFTPPEVENFEVELKKDSQGLGITIAGYVCERGIIYFNRLVIYK